jgi:hypothetical protein
MAAAGRDLQGPLGVLLTLDLAEVFTVLVTV